MAYKCITCVHAAVLWIIVNLIYISVDEVLLIQLFSCTQQFAMLKTQYSGVWTFFISHFLITFQTTAGKNKGLVVRH